MNKKYKINQVEAIIEKDGCCDGIACEYCCLYFKDSICQRPGGVFDYPAKMEFAKKILTVEKFKLL